MLPLLLVLVVLMWPDLSELELPGFFTLKRRVVEQEKRQDRLEGIMQSVQQAAVLSVRQEFNFLPPVDWERTGRQVQEKEARFIARGDEQQPQPVTRVRPRTPDEATLEVRLLAAWEEILKYLQAVGAGNVGRPIRDPPSFAPVLVGEQVDLVQRWAMLFEEEISLVRAARNKVAHPPHDLSREDLEEAVGVAERLVSILRTGLSRSSPPVTPTD